MTDCCSAKSPQRGCRGTVNTQGRRGPAITDRPARIDEKKTQRRQDAETQRRKGTSSNSLRPRAFATLRLIPTDPAAAVPAADPATTSGGNKRRDARPQRSRPRASDRPRNRALSSSRGEKLVGILPSRPLSLAKTGFGLAPGSLSPAQIPFGIPSGPLSSAERWFETPAGCVCSPKTGLEVTSRHEKLRAMGV